MQLKRSIKQLLLIALSCLIMAGCVRTWNNARPIPTGLPKASDQSSAPAPVEVQTTPTTHSFSIPTRDPSQPYYTPTPDMPHALPTLRTNEETYVVQRGDSLGSIAQRYGVDLNTLVNANQITNPDLLEVGTTLIIPAPLPLPPGPDFKIIPDSELVLGPNTISFDVGGFLDQTNGYLASYHGEIEEGVTYSGAEIVQRISREFSVNPRILLAVIEYQTGWVTRPQPDDYTLDFPAGYTHPAYKGLYRQLAWTANNLNRGYYLWKAGGISGWLLADGSVIPPAPTINAGTAGVQHLFSLLFNQSAWQKAVTQNGLSAAYQSLFGIPFDYAVEPLIPENLTQPTFQLPFESGQVWSFTGGPHGGWGSGSAWAALDFAPPGDALGCVSSDAWVTAIADGLIVHAADGAVIQDLDADGYAQTGWSILYMHIETRDRVADGTYVKAGERIGHPSCEGGVSNGTHVHLARRYNGEWIAADGPLPFILDGWVSSGDGIEYDGWLTNNGQTVEAWDSRQAENQIYR